MLVVENVGEEFGEGEEVFDGISQVLALCYSVICVPVLVHMMWVNIMYFDYLDDSDIRLAHGHYYVDVKTTSRYKATFHLLFFFRRMLVVVLLLFAVDWPMFQLMALIALSVIGMIYVGYHLPYRNTENNTFELANEAFTFNTLLLSLTSMNSAFDLETRHSILGWWYIGFWVGATLMNLFFIIYAVLFKNYETTLGYLSMLK
mmetsp:Transcript_14973/g.23168  ORF Transcript_14973/g.23168 Transcript_14973/m.23168 type:complete len:203 (+) Transcript_14973:6725-7333(+)